MRTELEASVNRLELWSVCTEEEQGADFSQTAVSLLTYVVSMCASMNVYVSACLCVNVYAYVYIY